MKSNNSKIIIRDLVEIGIFVSISILFDTFLKIPISIAGGSINISLIPLLIISLRHGPFKGFIAGGIVFGLITNVIDGYGFITYPLDYLIAFGSVSLLGLFSKAIDNSYSNKKYLSFVISFLVILLIGVVRFFAASLDSMLVYKYTMIESILYNLAYIPFTILIDEVVFMFLLPSIIMLNKRFKTNYLLKHNNEKDLG